MRALAAAVALLAAPAGAQESCDGAITTVEINACASDILAAADAELNKAYQAAIAQAQVWDADPDRALYGAPDEAESRLRRAQRAWVAYRDAACDALPELVMGGSMATMTYLGCLTSLTEERTAMLQAYAEG